MDLAETTVVWHLCIWIQSHRLGIYNGVDTTRQRLTGVRRESSVSQWAHCLCAASHTMSYQ